jgi:hypothetical protein
LKWRVANRGRKAVVLSVALIICAIAFGTEGMEHSNVRVGIRRIPQNPFYIETKPSNSLFACESIVVSRPPPKIELFYSVAFLEVNEGLRWRIEKRNARDLLRAKNDWRARLRNDVTSAEPRINSWRCIEAHKIDSHLHVFGGDVSTIDPLRNEIPFFPVARERNVLQKHIGSVRYPIGFIASFQNEVLQNKYTGSQSSNGNQPLSPLGDGLGRAGYVLVGLKCLCTAYFLGQYAVSYDIEETDKWLTHAIAFLLFVLCCAIASPGVTLLL